MDIIRLIPIILASLALAYASFKKNKNWTFIAAVIWIVLFMFTFYIVK